MDNNISLPGTVADDNVMRPIVSKDIIVYQIESSGNLSVDAFHESQAGEDVNCAPMENGSKNSETQSDTCVNHTSKMKSTLADSPCLPKIKCSSPNKSCCDVSLFAYLVSNFSKFVVFENNTSS